MALSLEVIAPRVTQVSTKRQTGFLWKVCLETPVIIFLFNWSLLITYLYVVTYLVMFSKIRVHKNIF
uniref:Uncharacterized protein n=1 Tax=Otolemur garnettii TaxID=30611 RepID=H0Y2H9_OTOGA